VIRRATMSIERMPVHSEELELRTWCSGAAKSLAERRTSVRGDRGAAIESEAIWVHVDPETRRPIRLPQAFKELYAESAEGRRARSSLRHPSLPPRGAEQLDWSFGRADIDLAGHVNNAWYWRVAEEFLDLEIRVGKPLLVEAEYRAGIGPGRAEVLRNAGMLWVSSPEGQLAATISAGALASSRSDDA